MDATEANRELTKSLTSQMFGLQKDLDQCLFFKSRLLTSLSSGIISEDDYNWMKTTYSDKIATLENQMARLALEIRDVIDHKGEFLTWLEAIYKNSHTKPLDRALIAKTTKDIRVAENKDVKVGFIFRVDI